MPELKVPADMCGLSENFHYEENYKTESVSSRSSSPKSLTDTDSSSLSEVSESPDGSVISDLELEAERIANDLDNMKITEIQAEEMMKEGMDMRHVLAAAWKLKPKITKKFKKGTKLNGSAVLKLLNFANYDEEVEEDQTTKMSRAWAQYEKSLGRKTGRVPPGFEDIDTLIEKKLSLKEREQILVSYANGTSTLSLATDPMTVHDVTVSCVLDTCRGFVQQTKNPTFVGLKHLEEEMLSTFSLEAGSEVMRPIATGSVLAVFSDDKWYRCQVVGFNATSDTVDIKFVDHGGYTTVSASQLRQLKSEFLRLPFQAIEVYFAHVNPADHEVQVDIASEILFNSSVSLQLVGSADDGVPMVQAYYYDGDYVRLFNQDVLDTCMTEVPQTLLTPVTDDSSSEDSSCPSPDTPDQVDTPPNEALPAYPVEYGHPMVTHDGHPIVPAPPAYIYTDEAGYQHVYYVTGPYVIMPVPQVPHYAHDGSLSPHSDDSVVSYGPVVTDTDTTTSEEEATTSSDSSESENSYDFINKPFEEWTQDDYARYYGDC